MMTMEGVYINSKMRSFKQILSNDIFVFRNFIPFFSMLNPLTSKFNMQIS